ncbi:phosphotransferase [Embleya sp. NPDC050154]|uniref:phosphotransferase n=1 Tax=Embleya sp. NPDC050154 TaxID=3363988 RepID=UPI0037B04F20
MAQQLARHSLRSDSVRAGQYADRYPLLGIPRGALSFASHRQPWQSVPFGMVHNDLHPENILRSRGETFVIDCDLAQWGPITRGLAQHCAEFDYAPSQLAEIKERAANLRPDAASSIEADFDRFIGYERELKATSAPLRIEAGLAKLAKMSASEQESGLWALAASVTALVNAAVVQVWGREPLEPAQVAKVAGSLLRTLAASKPSARILELGTGAGASAAWLLSGMSRDGSLLTVESDDRLCAVAEQALGGDERMSGSSTVMRLGCSTRWPAAVSMSSSPMPGSGSSSDWTRHWPCSRRRACTSSTTCCLREPGRRGMVPAPRR